MATVVMKRPRSSSSSKHHGVLYYPLPRRARFSFSPAPVPRPLSSPSASFRHPSFARPSTSSHPPVRKPPSSSAAPASSSSSLSAPRANVTNPAITTASGVSALEALLSRPLQFVPATNLTEEDEMVATLRPRKVKGDSIEQRRRRERVSQVIRLFFSILISLFTLALVLLSPRCSNHLLSPCSRSKLSKPKPKLTPPRATVQQTNHISSKWQVGAGLRPRGMRNFNGEVCYRHSVLQTLLHLPKFGNWLTDGHPADCS